jgi:riboflavin biosynthesis pyrimidine reductase
MVSSADGKAAVGDSESALSSATDKLVLQSLRVHADAILNGAATARATGVNPTIRDQRMQDRRRLMGRPEAPIQAVLSGSGDLGADPSFLRQNSFQVVLFVSDKAPPDRVASLRSSGTEVHGVHGGAAGLIQIVETLHQKFGVRLLLLEGGPTLNSEFFHAGLIDELFTTVGPHIVAGRDLPSIVNGVAFTAKTMPALELLSAYSSPPTAEVYLHWRVRR